MLHLIQMQRLLVMNNIHWMSLLSSGYRSKVKPCNLLSLLPTAVSTNQTQVSQRVTHRRLATAHRGFSVLSGEAVTRVTFRMAHFVFVEYCIVV